MREYYPSENCLPKISGKWNLLLSGENNLKQRLCIDIIEDRHTPNTYTTTIPSQPEPGNFTGAVTSMGPNMCTAVFMNANEVDYIQLYLTKDKNILKMTGYAYSRLTNTNNPKTSIQVVQINAYKQHTRTAPRSNAPRKTPIRPAASKYINRTGEVASKIMTNVNVGRRRAADIFVVSNVTISPEFDDKVVSR